MSFSVDVPFECTCCRPPCGAVSGGPAGPWDINLTLEEAWGIYYAEAMSFAGNLTVDVSAFHNESGVTHSASGSSTCSGSWSGLSPSCARSFQPTYSGSMTISNPTPGSPQSLNGTAGIDTRLDINPTPIRWKVSIQGLWARTIPASGYAGPGSTNFKAMGSSAPATYGIANPPFVNLPNPDLYSSIVDSSEETATLTITAGSPP
jgi:hypothetical protein